MKKNFLSKLQKRASSYSVWIDYLRLIIKDDEIEEMNKLTAKMLQLDFDNSSIWYLHFRDYKLSVKKVHAKHWIGLFCCIVYDQKPVPIFDFVQYDEHNRNQNRSWGKLVFYGLYYRLLEIWEIKRTSEDDYLRSFIQWVCWDKAISRIDYRIDLFYNSEKELFKITDITKVRKNLKIEKHFKWKDVESWRFWDRKSKRYIVRWYDKLADTMKKWKFWFYKDYFKFKNVYRLEFEFLNHFCKWYSYKNILNLIVKIQGFLDLDKSIWTIFESRNQADMDDIQNRLKYSITTKWYIKGCIENDINIFGLLDDVFESMWFKQSEIRNIFLDYLWRKKDWYNMIEKKEDVELWKAVYEVFWEF